jgi:release factor glutamine methyltransferase
MKIQEALVSSKRALFSFPNPGLESEVLLAWVLRVPRVFLRTHTMQQLTWFQQQHFFRAIQKRLKHVPVAYITQRQAWGSFSVRVTSHVLIPRDETEILLDIITRTTKAAPQTVYDIGTGSGVIAIAMAQAFPSAAVHAVDVSLSALHVAQLNAHAHQKYITFHHSSLCDSIPNNTHIDAIVANLPYVPLSVAITQEVQKEPHNAIFAQKNGLELIGQLQQQLVAKNISFSNLWLEFLPQQAAAIAQIFSGCTVRFHKDFSGQIFFAQISPAK